MNEIVRAEIAKNKVVWVRVGAGIAAVAVLALAAPLIWAAVSAGMGLIAFTVVGVVCFGIIQSLPLLGQKLENKILAARKQEARQNPIEQLQRYLMDRRQQVGRFKSAVGQIGGQIKSLEGMLEDRKRARPGYDASKQEKSLLAMNQAHQILVNKYKNAEKAVDSLEEVIEDKKFEWQFGNAGQAAIRSLNATSGQDLLNEMLADEAFASVRDNFNSVFADLEMEAARLTTKQALEFDNGMTIDLSSIDIPMASAVKGG